MSSEQQLVNNLKNLSLVKIKKDQEIIKGFNGISKMSRDTLMEVYGETFIDYHVVKEGILMAVELIGEQSEEIEALTEENKHLKQFVTKKDQQVIEESKKMRQLVSKTKKQEKGLSMLVNKINKENQNC